MDRRSVLKHLGGAGTAAGLAGCVGVQEDTTPSSGGSDGGETDGGEGEGTDAGTGTSGPAGSATAWYSLPETEIPAREDVLSSFNDGSRHSIEGADISDMTKKTTSAIPAGEGPRTFEWAHDWVGDYYQRGFVVDQSDQLEVGLDRFTDAAAEAIQFEGNVVGLPHSAETVSLIYNTNVVDERPETVADMVAVMEEYHDPDANQYGLSYPFDPYFVSAWLQAFGGYYFDASENEVLGINSAETVEGLQFALDNFRPYMPNDPKYAPQAAPFAEGNAAFAINGPWYLATLNDKGVNYEVAPLPTVEGSDPNPYTGITMWYFSKAMEADDADTAAARSFIEWFVTNEDHVLQVAEDQGAIPVLDSLVGSDELPSEVQAFSRTVEMGTPMPTRPRMNKVWTPMKNGLIKAFNGDASPQAAMDEAANTVRSNWD